MTTKQTIDGVPRALLQSLYTDTVQQWGLGGNAAGQLRALLDAPAEPKPTGLSQGWNLTRKHDGFVVGHQSVAYPPDEKAIERAERDGYVWVPFLVPAAQPQGEPVAYRVVFSDGEKSKWEDGAPQSQDLYDVRDGVIRSVECAYSRPAELPNGEPVAWVVFDNGFIDDHTVVKTVADDWADRGLEVTPLYAEQPAPVLVTLNQVLAAYDYAEAHPHKYLRGTTNWCAAVAHKLNACLDELKRLNGETP